MAHLTQHQRYEISTLHSLGKTQDEIGQHIGKDRSVICRELKRNCDMRNGSYKADLAQSKAQARHKSKPKMIYFTESIKAFVDEYLELDFSPEQIVGYAKRNDFPCVSIERIYQYVWQDKKQNGHLYTHLRSKPKRHTKRGHNNAKRGQIPHRVDIGQRPKIVEEKSRFGDLEIDLVIGQNHKGALLTINDRATGMLKMAKLASKEALEVETKTIELLKDWKPFLHTITSDNGKEFTNHLNISKSLEIDYYFATPYHSWERGANENLNGLIRQYFPKKTSFEDITQEQIEAVTYILNNRPRKRFDYFTPYEVFIRKSA